MNVEDSFLFIREPDLREALESDYIELQKSIANECWKAATVLSGSIIESLLVHHLSTETGLPKPPDEMFLVELIAEARTRGILTPIDADLSAVIRQYRNLIHPGREVRLGEHANQQTASIAQTLVSIVLDRLSVRSIDVSGYGADQLIEKICADRTAMSIAPHLIDRMPDEEVQKLLISSIPDAFTVADAEWDFLSDPEPLLIRQLPDLFDIAYRKAKPDVCEKVALNYVELVVAAEGSTVTMHESYLFLPDFLEHLEGKNREIVVDHLLAKLRLFRMTLVTAKRLVGLYKHLDPEQYALLLDAYFRVIGYQDDDKIREQISDALFNEWLNSELDEFDAALAARCKIWIRTATSRGQEEVKERFESFLSLLAFEDNE